MIFLEKKPPPLLKGRRRRGRQTRILDLLEKARFP
jgi:hypothetical protein